MRRPTKFLLILLTLHLSFLTSLAQKRQIDDAQALLRKGKDFAKVEKMMTDLLKKDSVNISNLRIYDVWLESVEKQYGELNEKMYKRQAVDTTRLFTLTRRIFTIAERLDSIDMRPDKKGRVNPEYRKGNAQRLMGYRPNLFFVLTICAKTTLKWPTISLRCISTAPVSHFFQHRTFTIPTLVWERLLIGPPTAVIV